MNSGIDALLNGLSSTCSRTLIQSKLKKLHGFLPVNKPRGIDVNNILNAVRKDLYFTCEHCGLSIGKMDVNYARALEPSASGLITLIFNSGNYRKRNFVFAECKYRLSVEFGVKRRYDCADGEFIERASIDHIDFQSINNEAQTFLGKVDQPRERHVTKSVILPTNPVQEMYSRFPEDYVLSAGPEKPPQKYKLVSKSKEVECYDIRLLDYIEPIARFEVTCMAAFSYRQFVAKLAENLGTQASLISIERIQEGPMSLDDMRVMQLHELHLEEYIHRLHIMNDLYRGYVSQFDEKFVGSRKYIPRM